jgi:DHA1 family bicyclomycin/chloramphenicol resistance-like MFS transporter
VVLYLAAIATIGQFSTSVYVPSIPAIGLDLAVPVSLVQLTIAAYLVPVACGQLLVGAVADRWGRRRILIAGMLLFLAGTALCAATPTVGLLFAGRVLQGLGASAGLVVARAVARDLFEGPELVRAVSVIAIAFAVIPGLAPLIGGVIEDLLSWRATFAATLALGFATLAGYLRAVPETLKPGVSPSIRLLLRVYGTILSDGAFQRHALVSAGPIAGIFAFLAGGPVFVIREHGMSASLFGLFPPVATTGFIIFNRIASRHLETRGTRWVVRLGLALALFGATLALVLRASDSLEVFGLTLCMWLFSGGMGIVVPFSTAQAMQFYPDSAGSASAVIGFEQMVGGIVGAAGVAALSPHLGSLAFPVVMTAAAATAFAGFLVMTEQCAS